MEIDCVVVLLMGGPRVQKQENARTFVRDSTIN